MRQNSVKIYIVGLQIVLQKIGKFLILALTVKAFWPNSKSDS